ncbi:hypothetical protein L6Q96_14255 [Candidatus Binatia bacterium]|nr:hypothetical protein [Candidatus Binatia bacterium]
MGTGTKSTGGGSRGRESGRRPPRVEKASQPATDKWWVDKTGVDKAPEAKQLPGPAGSKFFELGRDFDQEKARERLSDDNLKVVEAAIPSEGAWGYVQLAETAYPGRELDRIKKLVALPAYARGVIVDCGRSVRLLVTGTPAGERLLELTLGEEPSFDCWIRGEWVGEAVFKDAERALAALHGYIEQYLSPEGVARLDASTPRA